MGIGSGMSIACSSRLYRKIGSGESHHWTLMIKGFGIFAKEEEDFASLPRYVKE